MSNAGYTVQSTQYTQHSTEYSATAAILNFHRMITLQQTSFKLARPCFGKMLQRCQVEETWAKCQSHHLKRIIGRQIICRDIPLDHLILIYTKHVYDFQLKLLLQTQLVVTELSQSGVHWHWALRRVDKNTTLGKCQHHRHCHHNHHHHHHSINWILESQSGVWAFQGPKWAL